MYLKKGKVTIIIAVLLIFCNLVTLPVQAAPKQSIDYSTVFNATYYAQKYPDLQAVFGMDEAKLLAHFITYGMQEGRNASSNFHVASYMAANPDLQTVFGKNDLRLYYHHYIQYGKQEGRVATGNSSIPKVVTNKPADKTTQEAASLQILATYTTQYDERAARAINIRIASQRLNQKVLQPGEEISFSQVILSRIPENGYVDAPSFASGKIVSSIGGGICQVSSTLCTTAMLAGIKPSERHAHSLPVSYVPKGYDATVAEGVKDFRFQNPFTEAITILSTAQDGKLTIALIK